MRKIIFKKSARVSLVLILLTGIIASLIPTFVSATATEQEYYKSQNGAAVVYGNGDKIAMEFAAQSSYTLNSFNIRVSYQSGSQPSAYHVYVYAGDTNGYPTGSALWTSASINGSTLSAYPGGGGGTITTFSTSAITITSGNKYDIVLVPADGEMRWSAHDSNPYATGKSVTYDHDTTTWSDDGTNDSYFDIYSGTSAPTFDASNTIWGTEHTTTSVNINFEIGTFGGASSASYYVEYGTSTGSYGTNSTTQNYTYIGNDHPALQAPITSLSSSTLYYGKIVLTTSGGTIYSPEFIFIANSLTSNSYVAYSNQTYPAGTSGAFSYNISNKTWYALGRYWIFKPDEANVV
jgi:hypothetical protein